MNFEPRPRNDFPLFIHTYFDRCCRRCPKLGAIAGKWNFEDLLPGLSDFDTRLIATDDTTAADWARMSLQVGEVHGELAREQPQWARILEHLPGLNLTRAEMVDPIFYYPEFQQWTLYEGDGQLLADLRTCVANRTWSRRDELFHLKKFAAYVGPYQDGIDPPVNLGPWESKYPLHSRFMHYFTPAVQAAVCILERRGVGKMHALRVARAVFPGADVIEMVLEAVERHYEVPDWYDPPKLAAIDRRLERYLRDAWSALGGHVTLVAVDAADTPQRVRAKVKAVPADLAERFFEGIRFCRLMKGRLLFYAQQIDWFDTAFLIRNELGRIVRLFYEQPLNTYGLARFGRDLPPQVVLQRLRGDILGPAECDGLSLFVERAGVQMPPGGEKQRAREVAEVFDPVLVVAEKLGADMRPRVADEATG